MTEKKLTYKEMKAKKKPATQDVWIVSDDSLGAEYEEANRELLEARVSLNLTPNSYDAKERVEKAEVLLDEVIDRIKESSMQFTFRSISRKKLDKLLEDNQPSAKAKAKAEEAGEELNFDPDSFPPALIAATCISPELTLEEAQEIWESDDWTQGELLSLLGAAMTANARGGAVSLKKG
jgi:hypothetical protein